jgi:hypothetical protein
MRFNIALLFLLSLPSLLGAAPTAETSVDSLARDYAGLSPATGSTSTETSTAVPLKDVSPKSASPEPVVLQKKSSAQIAWAAYEKSIGIPLRSWAAAEVAPPKGGTVFYPFSGPDLVTVAQMFPEADRYILVAIQPAGPPVDLASMNPAELSLFRKKFSEEWAKFGILGFFRTLDLNENTASSTARLTSTPVMMAFAASLGFQVDAVTPLGMDNEKSDYAPIPSTQPKAWNSVRLELSKQGRNVLVDYICLDLSDDYLKTHQNEATWIKNCAKNPTLLKAASHLLPKPYFSVCRSALVNGTPLLVQDETGLEYKDLKSIGTLKLYGRFVEPHKLFDSTAQRDLAAAYAENHQFTPLPFSFSYQKAADRRSLQVVRRSPPQ